MLTAILELFPVEVREAFGQLEARLEAETRFEAGCPARLQAAIHYSLLAPGKRLRPLLVLAANAVCGGQPNEALPAACAVEMIHTYSLVHDDLPAMDDDDLRRGRPTCHIQFDEATAILVGDALIPRAFEVLANNGSDPRLASRCVLELARAAGAAALVGGQADDLQAEFAEPDPEWLQTIHARKTAAMIAVSLKLGALTAGAAENQVQRLENFGKKLGLAFQIADDLLDLRGDQSKMGKKTQKDPIRGKLTYPAVLGVERSLELAVALIAQGNRELEPLGLAAAPLQHLAQFVIERTQ